MRRVIAMLAAVCFNATAANLSSDQVYDKLESGNREVVVCAGSADGVFYGIDIEKRDLTYTTLIEFIGDKRSIIQINGVFEHKRMMDLMNRATSVVTDSVFKDKPIQIGRLSNSKYTIGVRVYNESIVYDVRNDGDFDTITIKHKQMMDINQCLSNIDNAMKKFYIDY